MRPAPQFTHLNHGDPWPSLAPPFQLEIDSDGFLRLTTDGSGNVAASGAAIFGAVPQSFSGPWSRISLQLREKPDASRIQVFTFSSNEPGPPPFSLSSGEPFATADGWTAMPADAQDFLIAEAGHFLWLGLQIRNGGNSTPEIEQIRLESGRNSFIGLLPPIYALEPQSKDITERFLKQLGVSFEEIEEKITSLPALFDADAAPHGEETSWLAWLADWLDFQLADAWEEDESRQNLGEAFKWYGKRGTIPGLRQYLKWYAGVTAIIEDSSAVDRLWVLGEDSPLGFRTALSPGSISGAVLGSETNLDKTHLAREDDCSAFDPYAHRFTVSIYCADLTRPGALDDAREILDREKPANTEYTLCTIEPRMRVGCQARVGIDSIVAGSEPLAQLDCVLDGTVMADAPESCSDDRGVENTDCRVCDDEEEVS